MPTRRRILKAGLVATGLAGCAQPTSPNSPDPEPTNEPPSPTQSESTNTDQTRPPSSAPMVQLETITTQPESPLALKATPSGGIYIADRPGIIYHRTRSAIDTALDITETVITGGERGLLGLALHPEFATNRRLYLRYSAGRRAGTPQLYSHTFVLAEFTARTDGTINPDSERTLLEIPQPQSNHNSGSIAFGPDGYLYIGVGDGGGGGDTGRGHVEDWYENNPGGNGQDITENLLGSMLRIDVDDRTGDTPYGIPDDNPLVGREGLDEHYAWGLRNPWGISYDESDFYVADVGQNRFEEVNLVEKGGNYGWNVKEGTSCFITDTCPTITPDGDRILDPVIEYPHSGGPVSGNAIIGGHVYRGDRIPALEGQYVFGDLSANGQLFRATPAGEGLWPVSVLEITETSRNKVNRLLGIGRDSDDELYALTPSGVHQLSSAEYS